jgi:hypothetical protein
MSPLRSAFVKLGLVIVTFNVCGAETTSGAIIFTENFEGPAVGDNVSVTNSIFDGLVSPGTGGTLQVTDEATSGITFTGSKFLRFVDGAGGVAQMRSDFTTSPLLQNPITELFKLSWDFYEPNAVISGTGTHFRVLLSQGAIATAGNRAVDLLFTALNDGVATTGNATNWSDGLTLYPYDTNTLVHYDLIGNVGPSVPDHPTQTFDLYKNNVLVGDNLVFRAPNAPLTDGGIAGSPITSIDQFGLGYHSGSNRSQSVFVDNVVLEAIPEPASLMLVAGAMGAVAIMRKRRIR